MSCGCIYEGSVPMKPEMEKRDFYCDDEISYPVPKIFYECNGEIYDSWSMEAWNDDSVIMVGDKRMVKYTETNFYDVRYTYEDIKDEWYEGRYADFLCYPDEDIAEVRETKRYSVEEYDLASGKKRKYKVVLEEVSDMDDWDNNYVKRLLREECMTEDAEYKLTDTYNRFS